jgi:hypothetical protein
MAPTPTPTLNLISRILPRQDNGATVTVVSGTTTVTSTSNGLSGGAIAGIVIGSIVGLILLILLIRWALTRNQGGRAPPTVVGGGPRSYRHRSTTRHYSSSSPHRSHSRRHHSGSRSRSRSVDRGHYRRSVEVVGAPAMSEPQRVYVEQSRHQRGRQGRRG